MNNVLPRISQRRGGLGVAKWNLQYLWAWASEWRLLPLRCSARATWGACVWSKMLAVQRFYAWTEYNTSKLSLAPLFIRATF